MSFLSYPQSAQPFLLSTHASGRMLKAKEEREGAEREKVAISFEVSRPAVYLINLYEIFLSKN